MASLIGQQDSGSEIPEKLMEGTMQSHPFPGKPIRIHGTQLDVSSPYELERELCDRSLVPPPQKS